MPSVISTVGPIIASLTPPEEASYYVGWLNLNNGRLYTKSGDDWVRAGEGLTGSRVIDGGTKRLTFTDGILTDYEEI